MTLELALKDRLHFNRQRVRCGKCRKPCEGWLVGYVTRYGERDGQVPASSWAAKPDSGGLWCPVGEF